MAAAVAGIRPKLMVLLETEIWPGLLQALKAQRCKSIIVNGRITAKSLNRYHLWPSIWQTLRPDRVLAISAADADRFGRLFGRDGVDVMANIKFDRMAPSGAVGVEHNRIKSILPAGAPFLVFASVRQEEESEVKEIVREISRKQPQAVMGFFPRHIQRLKYWQDTLSDLGKRWVLRAVGFTVGSFSSGIGRHDHSLGHLRRADAGLSPGASRLYRWQPGTAGRPEFFRSNYQRRDTG